MRPELSQLYSNLLAKPITAVNIIYKHHKTQFVPLQQQVLQTFQLELDQLTKCTPLDPKAIA